MNKPTILKHIEEKPVAESVFPKTRKLSFKDKQPIIIIDSKTKLDVNNLEAIAEVEEKFEETHEETEKNITSSKESQLDSIPIPVIS